MQTLQPAAVEQLFRSAMYGAGRPGGAPAPETAAAVAAVKAFCARYRVQAVVADPIGVDPQEAISVVSAALGSPQLVGGVYVWYLDRAGATAGGGARS